MSYLDSLWRRKRIALEAHVLMLGLDNTGKSCILNHLLDEDVTMSTPTKGFFVKSINYDDYRLHIKEIGGYTTCFRCSLHM